MDILQILEQIANYFHLDWQSILTISAYIVVVVNFLKATSPFNQFVFGERIPFVTAGLALVVSAFISWGQWLTLLLNAVFISIVSIGGWATAKMLVHKVGTTPTNASGGQK